MEANHASRGRRTLEEIRQKRAAERMQQQHNPAAAASLVDPYGNPGAGAELLGRVRELENGNIALERENQMLLSKERNIVPSLKKAVNDISLEKDAAAVAKAEEDSASLRAQLNTLQQQVMSNSYTGFPVGVSNEHILAMEKEVENLQAQLKQESLLRQQEQQKLSEESLLRQQEQQKLTGEQSHAASLVAEKKELEEKIAALTKKASDIPYFTGKLHEISFPYHADEASEFAARKAFSMEDREKLESQLHDMALMVERLEGSRQKLLMEIDSQSSEIEKLFEENSALSTSYQEAVAVTMQWENQVKDCLKQNEELRSHLEKLRLEQATLLKTSNTTIQPDGQNETSISFPPEFVTENLSLKDQLIKEQSRSEGLSAEIMKLSAELRKAVQAQNNLARLLKGYEGSGCYVDTQ
uniref:Uncharacterized protein n=1 Tax=Oryza sativa subsp. japonica TaxID=39947 RepID=Q84JM0_ORYSJ|nr:hypothetical protein [Oryza sativa Japonica Group]AAP06898.1 hypothetical protein [Oryza sativa Japonica Group]